MKKLIILVIFLFGICAVFAAPNTKTDSSTSSRTSDGGAPGV